MGPAVTQKLAGGATRRPSSRAFFRCHKGATAVEFALVAAPFLALLVAILQAALVFFASRVLDEVTEEAARNLMTGQAQQGNVTQANFLNNYVCGGSNTSALVSALFTCSKIMVNVQNYPDFASANVSSPTLTFNPTNGNVTNTWSYNTGNPGDVLVIEVIYEWPIVLGPLGMNLSNLSDGNRELVSVAVFKSEPY
ncbi:MAG TPA: TadE/TadG family type IV pilus assembly protein [Xanthobacteraceae bacterium]|nr:TadE/TadG family type IV pilus assembly protein [Xanthobacteraceae bacterium]